MRLLLILLNLLLLTGICFGQAKQTNNQGVNIDTLGDRTAFKIKLYLENVDNTSDLNKPISTLIQAALDLKAPINNPTFTGTVGGITKSMVGLGSVENTALSTWAGSANITTLGTIATGTWQGADIADAYIAGAAGWDLKQEALVSGTNIKTINSATLLGSGNIAVATSAQGALADTALQASAIGVSVQAYSAILDGTTASFTSAMETKLGGIEALADVTDTANVTAAGALMDSEVTNLAAVKSFDPAAYATAAQGALADTALQAAAIGTTIQAYSAILAGTTASFTTAQETKLGHISVAQAVNLDTMESDIATNNAKVTNATHTGDATGSGALTVVALNGTNLASLGTGILKNTTGTGVPSIAVAGDFPTLNQSTTGSAATLTTSRNINGVAFNGSGDITVTAAAGTLTGATLNATVTGSSLTSLGTIGTGVWQGTAVADAYVASAATWNAKQSAITFGTGVQAALGVNIGSAGAPVLFDGAGGTPSSLVGTNITGTAAGLTAGNVTTNANLTGHITSTGNATLLGSFTVAQLSTAISDADISGTNTGDQTITLTGNVTGSGTGSFATTIGAGVVTNSMLAGSIDLTSKVIGILPVANGGTNNAFFTVAGPATSAKTYTFPNASSTVLTTNAAVTVAQGGTGRATSTTAYGLIAAGTTATGAQQTLAAGATTEILVGGGASALPVWTTATGSGAPVRATSPALVTPALGTPTALVGTNITGTAAGLTAGTVTTNANLTGDVTSSGNATTLSNSGVSAGTYRSVTVDSKGRVTEGTNPTVLTTVTAVPMNGGIADYTFSSIPAGVKRITINFDNVSLSGSQSIAVRLGDSGGIEISGYLSGSNGFENANLYRIQSGVAASAFSGTMTLIHMGSNKWVSAHSGYIYGSTTSVAGGGTKTLSGELTQIQILDTGSDTFDGAGEVSITYE